MNVIYHLTTTSAWDDALTAGEYRADSLAIEGFIHASTIHQVVGSANRYYSLMPAMVLLKIDPDQVQSPLVWEQSSHSETPFPHIYGPLNLGAVVEVILWERSLEGAFDWPPILSLSPKDLRQPREVDATGPKSAVNPSGLSLPFVIEKTSNMPFLLAAIRLEKEGLIAWVVMGLISGFVAGRFMKGGGFGMFGDIVVGLIGSVLGGYVVGAVTQGTNEGFFGSILVSFIGACVFILLSRAIFGRTAV